MNKTLNNYFYKAGLLFAFTLCINFTNKIIYCALLFTFLTLIVNCIAKCHGSKKATISIILCTTPTLGLLYNKPYYIAAGKPISGLIAASLCAILIASYIGFKLFLKLEARCNLCISNFISLLSAALVDGLIMGIFFASKFPMHKVFVIFYKALLYKSIFAFILYVSSVTVVYSKQVYFKIRSSDARLSLLRKLYLKRRPYKE